MVVKFYPYSAIEGVRGFSKRPDKQFSWAKREGAFLKRVELLLVPVFNCFGTVIWGKSNVQLQLVATNLNGGRLNLYVNRSGVMGCVWLSHH